MKLNININLIDIAKTFQSDILNRISEVKEIIEKKLPWKTPESINNTIKYFEFKERYPEVEDDLSYEYRSYFYKLSETNCVPGKLNALKEDYISKYHQKINCYKQEIEYSIIEKASGIALNFVNKSELSELFSEYYKIDFSLSQFEHLIDLSLFEFDKMVQREIDLRRGK